MGAAGVGLYSYLGSSAAEATFGTAQTRDNFLEFTNESLNWTPTTKSAQGIRATGLVPLATQDKLVSVAAAGDINCYVPTKGFGRYLAMSLGAPTTTTITGTPNAYQHVFTMQDLDGNSRTFQVGMKQDGAYVTKTITGGKVTSLKLALAQSDFLTATISIDGQDATEDEDADTPTFLAGRGVFSFVDGAITVDGSPYVGVTAYDLTIPTSLKTDSYYLGAQGKKGEQARDGFPQPTGTLTADWIDDVLTGKFLSQASLGLVLTMTAATINAVPAVETFKVELPSIKLGGDLPQVGGPGVISLSSSFRVLDDGTNPPVKITYIESAETAVT